MSTRYPVAFAALLVAITCTFSTITKAQIVLENGNVFENIKYSSDTTFDANTKLKDETAYSSMILWKNCKVSDCKVTLDGTFDPTKTFATSLYLKIDGTTFNSWAQFYFNDLPPNSYVHAVGTVGKSAAYGIYNIHPTTESNNITTLVDDSTIQCMSAIAEVFVKLSVPESSPYIVTHIRNAKLTKAYGVFSTTTLTKGSTIFIEMITCTKCSFDLIWLNEISFISEQSALILKDITVVNHVFPGRDGLIRTGQGVIGVDIDASSVLALIDIDMTNEFSTTKDRSLRLFYNTELTGEGAIVFLRIKMGPSGLDSPQPVDNRNFWVSAKSTSSRVMTADELLAVKFNVNTDNVINWDGTGADGKCVQAGLSLPGTATYELVNGTCEASCPKGNYLQPACTPRAVCTGVPNCEACYAHPKTLCLECAPHTVAANGDTVCKCPIRECMVCPTSTDCAQCSADHKYSSEQKSCFHCVIDKCALCKEDGKCFTCEDGYKIYNNQCISCSIEKCESCSTPGSCAECTVGYKPASDGQSCVSCPAPGCKACRADGVCNACVDGYYFIESPTVPKDNKCVRCLIEVPKCQKCEIDGVCSECIADHKPTAEGRNCFHCMMPSCTECSADSVCAECEEGYKLFNNQCIACNIEKCQSCNTPDNCVECTMDHKPTGNGKQCFLCSIPGCKECSADGECGACEDGYKLYKNKCIACSIENCEECQLDGVCNKCITGYKPTADGKNCYQCTLSSCTECSADGVCAQCVEGYKLFNNQCIACSIEKCETCKTDDVCSKCIDTYLPTGNGKQCFLCSIPGCKECSADDECGFCEDGYTLTESKCVGCTTVPDCVACKDEGVCLECIPGFKPANEGYKCFHCAIRSCKECSADDICALCEDGYSLTDNKCVSCGNVPNCVSCKLEDICHECITGHKPSANGKDCFHCSITGCKACRADDVCNACVDGYYFIESPTTPKDNKCVRCLIEVPKCQKCEIDGVCSECIANHKPTADGTNCFQCTLSSCTECSADGVCAQCVEGYKLFNNQCIACSIEKCEICKMDGVCSKCIDTYMPTGNGKQCFLCSIPGCKECSADGECGLCEDGYTLSDNECIVCNNVTNCRICKVEDICSECIAEHKPANEGKKCFRCTIPFCKECSADRICAICKDGYSLTDNKCVRCAIDVPNCEWCEADGICSQCIADHTLSTDGRRCTACNVDACQRCDLPGVCALCNTNMTTTGGSGDDGQCTPCAVDDCAYCSGNNTCALCNCGLVPAKDRKTCVMCQAANCKRCDPNGGGTTCAQCMGGYDVSNTGLCVKNGLPEWVVFVIVVAASIMLMITIAVGYILYLRHVSAAAQMVADAEQRRHNRQRRSNRSRYHMEIAMLDLGDIEDAASGIRDTLKNVTL